MSLRSAAAQAEWNPPTVRRIREALRDPESISDDLMVVILDSGEVVVSARDATGG
jgi:hypothetical protein